jgi:membrane protein implicated in regulation of membrane protease activity
MNPTREPLGREALITAAIAVAVQLLLLLGVSQEWAAWAGSAITLAALAWTVYRVRPQVTPVADPRDNQGRALTP